jgi:formylglycine-generating enzyme required for sulfatase activity
MVSWDEVQLFLKELNVREKKPGWVYRLPKESEWEYACRGGPQANKSEYGYDFYFEKPSNQLLPDHANWGDRLKRPCKIGSYKPNSLGLYDMHGNVAEWCDDKVRTPGGTFHRVIRGGAWASLADFCRAATHMTFMQWARNGGFGLRVARVPEGQEHK